ncbi:MAG: Mur ligase family protein [Brevinema sp.]
MILDLIMQISSIERVDASIYPTRTYELLKQVSMDPDLFKYIHITGSKGKGSIARTSFDLLKQSGIKTGLFTSPHIFDVTERIHTNDGNISEDELLTIFYIYRDFLEKQKLHFFEIMLFFAIVYFTKKNCEIVVLEVGVGGRFDPTNFCKDKIALIGQVSSEHLHFLGGSLAQIAYNKAGIIKKGSPAFSLPQENMVQKIFNQEGKIDFLSDDLIKDLRIDDHGFSFFIFYYSNQSYPIYLKRIGKAHRLNFILALVGVLEIFPFISLDTIQSVANQSIKYRIDLIRPTVLVDTAHNGMSFFYLFDAIKNYLKWNNIVLFVTLLEGKEIQDVVDQINVNRSLIKRLIVFDFDHKRPSDGKTLYQLLINKFPIEYLQDITSYPINMNEKNVFTGSFYSIPFINELLDKR